MDNFKEINIKIDDVKTNVNHLCNRVSLNEKDIDIMVKDGVKGSEHKHWVITSIFGAIAAVATAINVWDRFLN